MIYYPFIVFIVTCFLIFTGTFEFFDVNIYAIVSLVLIIYSFYAESKIEGKILPTFVPFFLLVFFIYHMSSYVSTVYLLRRDIGGYSSYLYSQFGVLCVCFISSIIFIRDLNINKFSFKDYLDFEPKDKKILFFLLVILSFFFLLYSLISSDFTQGYAERVYSNYDVYQQKSSLGFTHIFRYMHFILLGVSCFGLKTKKEMVFLMVLWMVGFFIPSLLIGNRGISFITGYCLLWLLYKLYKYPTKKFIIIIFLSGFFLAPLMSFIRQVPVENWVELDTTEIYDAITIEIFFWSDTTYTTLETIDLINRDAVPLWMGKSFYGDYEILFPNLFSTKRLGRNFEVSPSAWFVRYVDRVRYDKGGGYGFSIIAEIILNFGMFFFPIFSLLFGVFLLLVEYYFLFSDNKFVKLLMCGILFNILYVIRNDFFIIVKPALWGAIALFFYLFIFSGTFLKKGHGSIDG